MENPTANAFHNFKFHMSNKDYDRPSLSLGIALWNMRLFAQFYEKGVRLEVRRHTIC